MHLGVTFNDGQQYRIYGLVNKQIYENDSFLAMLVLYRFSFPIQIHGKPT